MIKTVKDIEARLATVSQELAALHYSQITIAWEAPLAGIITIKGELKHGESTPKPENAAALGKLDRSNSRRYTERSKATKKSISSRGSIILKTARALSARSGVEYCYQTSSDPIGPHHIATKPLPFPFIETPAARAWISLSRRGEPQPRDCTAGDKDFDDLAALTFGSDCRPTGGGAGTETRIQVAVGDVLYVTYSIHPHLAKWRKPTATISYVAVCQ